MLQDLGVIFLRRALFRINLDMKQIVCKILDNLKEINC